MRYVDFRDAIITDLRRKRSGLTWAELKERLRLPYQRACPSWVARMEKEDGLVRIKGDRRALVWKISKQPNKS